MSVAGVFFPRARTRNRAKLTETRASYATAAGSDPVFRNPHLPQNTPQQQHAGNLVGSTIGDFIVDAVIGGGSFGTVYRGRQLGLDRAVAIKVPTFAIAADPVQAQRFAREARAAARVVHPGVVSIYAVGELDDGRPYLAMQLIDGAPVDHLLSDGPLPVIRALRLAGDIASALSETHAAGVVHRDLKPANIMWRPARNGGDRITLVDFGIAVCRPGHADATRLTSGGLIGTPHYMSPEQAQGEQVDGRADLYALGCVLFELVTGDTPFEGAGFEVLLAHLHKPAPRASERNAEVPEVVDALIARLLEKRPADRPGNADEALALIDDALARLGGSRVEHRRWSETMAIETPRRHRGLLALLVCGVLAMAGGAAGVWQLREGYQRVAVNADVDDVRSPALVDQPRLITRDDGELLLRTRVPQVLRAGVSAEAQIEIRTKLGGAFAAEQVVVTVEDPRQGATALTAAIHGRPGHYAIRHTFAEPGRHILRIFPSQTETAATIELDVLP